MTTNPAFFIINIIGLSEESLQIDYIYDTLDDACMDGRFEEADGLIAVTHALPLELLLGVLTITSPWREKLKARAAAYEAARIAAQKLYGIDSADARAALRGLE